MIRSLLGVARVPSCFGIWEPAPSSPHKLEANLDFPEAFVVCYGTHSRRNLANRLGFSDPGARMPVYPEAQ